MSETVQLDIESAQALVAGILELHNTSADNATSVASALVSSQVDGQAGHGLSRVPSYAAQSASGKVNGHATPKVVSECPSGVRIDAAHGFAFPAMDLAISCLHDLSTRSGIAAAGVFHSHHFGQAGYHVERLANHGRVALAFGNSPKAIAPWGGCSGVFGTNPIAFAAPRAGQPPLVIDLSLSKVARGKVMVAANSGQPIPEGWALDGEGHPTTDAKAALNGTMVPMGDAKGAALVLMVEVLAAALTGANFGYEASSFFTAEGEPPDVGQFLLAINPQVFSGGMFSDRLESLLHTILDQPGTRLPGSRRLAMRDKAQQSGIAIPAQLYETLVALKGR